MMCAAVVTTFDEPLNAKEMPVAEPPVKPNPPLIPGHEVVGIVIKVGGVTPGDRVAIFGVGGLGHVAQQYAQIFGAETIAVDVSDEKLELARRLGAAHLINAAATDPVAAIKQLGGADVAIVPAADQKVVEQAHASLRPDGCLVLVSLPEDDTMAVPVFQTVLKGSRLIGSIVGIRADLAEVFRLHATVHSQVRYEAHGSGEIDLVLLRVRPGRRVRPAAPR
jgi:propanol-preferring alcohol dehydrogenase